MTSVTAMPDNWGDQVGEASGGAQAGIEGVYLTSNDR